MQQINGETATVKEATYKLCVHLDPCPMEFQLTLVCREEHFTSNWLMADGSWRVHLQLTPSHIRILCSEKADALAKVGTNKPQPTVNVMLTSVKNSDAIIKKSPPSPLQTGSAHENHGNALPHHPICQSKSLWLLLG
jgi:hypothetical protein